MGAAMRGTQGHQPAHAVLQPPLKDGQAGDQAAERVGYEVDLSFSGSFELTDTSPTIVRVPSLAR